jgi:hypothetical protein
MIDLGLVDWRDRLGFSLEPAAYDLLKQQGLLKRYRVRQRRSASGHYFRVKTAQTTAQLLDPGKQLIGPLVTLDVCRGKANVPQRVGVVFFHRLVGCRVIWELDRRNWVIEYP